MFDRVDKEKAAAVIQRIFRKRKGYQVDINGINGKQQLGWHTGNIQKDGKIKLFRYLEGYMDQMNFWSPLDGVGSLATHTLSVGYYLLEVMCGRPITPRKFNEPQRLYNTVHCMADNLRLLRLEDSEDFANIFAGKATGVDLRAYQMSERYRQYTSSTAGGYDLDPVTYWTTEHISLKGYTVDEEKQNLSLFNEREYCVEIELSPDEAFRCFDDYEYEWIVPGIIPSGYVTRIYQNEKPVYTRPSFDSYDFLRTIKGDPDAFHRKVLDLAPNLIGKFIDDMTAHNENLAKVIGVEPSELRHQYGDTIPAISNNLLETKEKCDEFERKRLARGESLYESKGDSNFVSMAQIREQREKVNGNAAKKVQQLSNEVAATGGSEYRTTTVFASSAADDLRGYRQGKPTSSATNPSI